MGNTAKIRHRRRRRAWRIEEQQVLHSARVHDQLIADGFELLEDDGVIRVFGRGTPDNMAALRG